MNSILSRSATLFSNCSFGMASNANDGVSSPPKVPKNTDGMQK